MTAVAANQFEPKARGLRFVMPPDLTVWNANFFASTLHGAAAVTLAADAVRVNQLAQIVFGYSGTPGAGATITVTDNGGTVFQMPVTASGMQSLTFALPKAQAALNTQLVVTLSDGGSGVTGYLWVDPYKFL